MKTKLFRAVALMGLAAFILVACDKEPPVEPTPGIVSFAPTSANEGATVTITGNNFRENPKVMVDNKEAEVVSANSSQIIFKVPSGFNHSASNQANIKVVNGTEDIALSTPLTITNVWIKKSEPAFEALYEGLHFVINNKIYFGSGGSNFRVYDLATNQWTAGPAVPFNTYYGKAIVLNNKAYITRGVGSTEIWEYDPSQTGTASWKQLTNYPGLAHSNLFFSVDGNIYIGLGYWSDNTATYFNEYKIYKLDLAANDGKGTWSQDLTVAEANGSAASFVINNTVYYGGGTDAEDLNNDTKRKMFWSLISPSLGRTTMQSLPINLERPTCVAFNGKGYIISYDRFLEYTPTTNSWAEKARVQMGGSGGYYRIAVVNNRMIGFRSNGQIFEYMF